jgi:DNA-binding GntR family transcriptional regulator
MRADRLDGFDNTTLRARVHQHLRDAILSARIPPGTVLQEVPLAASLGVSRGPLREALGDLAAEGLVTITPRRGAVVSSLTKRDFLEAYQVREALEVMAVRLAVPTLGAEGFATLERAQEAMVRSAARDDFTGFFDGNVAFHEAWVEAAGNAKLLDIYRRLMAQLVVYRRPSAFLRGGLDQSIREHQAIIEAARAADIERAASLMLQHIEIPQRRLATLTEEEFAHETQQAMLTLAGEGAVEVSRAS